MVAQPFYAQRADLTRLGMCGMLFRMKQMLGAVRIALPLGAGESWGRPLYSRERSYSYARNPGQPAIA